MADGYAGEYDARCDLEACRTYPTITDSERGEILCGGCGLVLLQKMEDVSHDHAYVQDRPASQGRTGPGSSLMMHDMGLSTVIGRDADATGRAIPSKTRHAFNRLRMWDQRSKSRTVSGLGKALILLNAVKTKLSVPDSVAENAAYIYRKAVSARLTRGRTTASLIAASLYASCRESNTPRTLSDVAGAANIERRVLTRDLRTLIRRLDLSLDQYDIEPFITKIANNLGLKEKTKRDAVKILQEAARSGITAGKNPISQAAASLYIASIANSESVSQKKLAKEAGVSDVTVRTRIAFLKKGLGC